MKGWFWASATALWIWGGFWLGFELHPYGADVQWWTIPYWATWVVGLLVGMRRSM